ncbi:sodium-dependent transporter [Paremcibacter congregatus]|uniref:Sodium-dependent transporter n=1 Tax=Paremcibacter congregatus TaxID=2043170 RepID=A0A2G4YQL4_9PROT|nr:sodium-dependent transporter [Paremcibacter congregatus]PHZ84621.1 sodium-dependent transporter [Paremcibacter congregatus]QDE28842.1 sodium-dependent transporter [Paremcibacter congregatus]
MQNRKWTSNLYFLAAAIGSAVGISNIWKFTYVAGENGGGAFILVYILALSCIALPALIAEFVIGRRGGQGVVRSMDVLAQRENISPKWRYYGWLAVIAVFIALSFYSVVAGWTIDYFVSSLSSENIVRSGAAATARLDAMLADPLRMMLYQVIFIGLTAATVAFGIKNGLEKMLGWMTPGLFIILAVLLAYATLYGNMGQALRFLFTPDFSTLTPTIILMAFGQAFFSLGVGVGVLMTIASYMDRETPMIRSAIIVAAADGGVALLAGLAIFPIVFAHGLSPAEGPGLIFATLPVAFGQMPGGAIVGPLFFLLLAVAALTSAITLLETVVACLEDLTSLSRIKLTIMAAVALWGLGLLTVFSYNIWADVKPLSFITIFEDKTIFGLLDYLVSNILMPLGGICVAVLAGWGLGKAGLLDELQVADSVMFRIWLFLIRFVVPSVISAVFLINLM